MCWGDILVVHVVGGAQLEVGVLSGHEAAHEIGMGVMGESHPIGIRRFVDGFHSEVSTRGIGRKCHFLNGRRTCCVPLQLDFYVVSRLNARFAGIIIAYQLQLAHSDGAQGIVSLINRESEGQGSIEVVEEQVDIVVYFCLRTHHHFIGMDFEVAGGKAGVGCFTAGGVICVSTVLGSHDDADVAVGDGLDAINSQLGTFAIGRVAGDGRAIGSLLGNIAVDVVVTRILYLHVQTPRSRCCRCYRLFIREGAMHRFLAVLGKEYVDRLVEEVCLLCEQPHDVIIGIKVISCWRSPGPGGHVAGATWSMSRLFLFESCSQRLRLEGDAIAVLQIRILRTSHKPHEYHEPHKSYESQRLYAPHSSSYVLICLQLSLNSKH